MKIFLVGDRFPLARQARAAIKSLTEFTIYIYGFYWFAITQTTDVPSLTLQLWQDVKKWEKREKKLSTSCLKKIDRHTWYLSGRQVIFSLWSKRVDEETKVEMARVWHQTPEEEMTPGIPDLPRFYEDSTLSDFVTTDS